MPVISSDSWPIITQEGNMKKGKLIRVEIRPGQFVKMYEADAKKRGLLPAAESKMRQPPGNKGRQSAGARDIEKTATTGANGDPDLREAIPADTDDDPEQATFDFETIPGIGPAGARALQANGIHTLEDLLGAQDLDYLTPQALEAIDAWRHSPAKDDEPEDLGG